MDTRKKKAAVACCVAEYVSGKRGLAGVRSGVNARNEGGRTEEGRDVGEKAHERAKADRLDTATTAGDERAQGAGVDQERA